MYHSLYATFHSMRQALAPAPAPAPAPSREACSRGGTTEGGVVERLGILSALGYTVERGPQPSTVARPSIAIFLVVVIHRGFSRF